ncbi:hypothetical protein DVH24_024758 [Malus domestica]|uniref:Uncharacterized protein n=1 Tax=Malus domestica TaxID=3750 RepID=A0A498JMG6_MALDO|nr:hypothetical protein DVH24_024758 [Malus domestica]
MAIAIASDGAFIALVDDLLITAAAGIPLKILKRGNNNLHQITCLLENQLISLSTSSASNVYMIKGRTQCTRFPLYAWSGRGECRLALPPFMERLLPSLEPETYRSWAKALDIAPSTTSSNVYMIFIKNYKRRKIG